MNPGGQNPEILFAVLWSAASSARKATVLVNIMKMQNEIRTTDELERRLDALERNRAQPEPAPLSIEARANALDIANAAASTGGKPYGLD